MELFSLFLTDDLINTMVIEINWWADQEIRKWRPLRGIYRLNNWNVIDYQEIRQFLGVVLHIGCVKLPTFEFPCFEKLFQKIGSSLLVAWQRSLQLLSTLTIP